MLIASIVGAEVASNSQIVNGLYQQLVSKLVNTSIHEFMNS